MSYAIINKIKVDNGKVFITSHENNVWPRTPHEWECKTLSELLEHEGQEKLDLEILKEYESGNFQGGKNKYMRALMVLRHMPEYKEFDWRNDWNMENNRRGRLREFEALLVKALNTRLPSEKYIIVKDISGKIVYGYHRKNGRSIKWYEDKEKATRFDFREDAVWFKKYFTGSEKWMILQA
jgi:hypothetical protein